MSRRLKHTKPDVKRTKPRAGVILRFFSIGVANAHMLYTIMKIDEDLSIKDYSFRGLKKKMYYRGGSLRQFMWKITANWRTVHHVNLRPTDNELTNGSININNEHQPTTPNNNEVLTAKRKHIFVRQRKEQKSWYFEDDDGIALRTQGIHIAAQARDMSFDEYMQYTPYRKRYQRQVAASVAEGNGRPIQARPVIECKDKMCFHCWRKGGTKGWYCPRCKVWLHSNNCFREWHLRRRRITSGSSSSGDSDESTEY